MVYISVLIPYTYCICYSLLKFIVSRSISPQLKSTRIHVVLCQGNEFGCLDNTTLLVEKKEPAAVSSSLIASLIQPYNSILSHLINSRPDQQACSAKHKLNHPIILIV